MSASLEKPIPKPTPDTQEFWDGCDAGVLRVQRCEECGAHVFFPSIACQRCHSADLGWVDCSGSGEIKTFTIVRRGVGAFAPDAPYTIAIVGLDEGPQLMTYIVDCEESELAIGKRVKVHFQPRGDRSLPVFRLA